MIWIERDRDEVQYTMVCCNSTIVLIERMIWIKRDRDAMVYWNGSNGSNLANVFSPLFLFWRNGWGESTIKNFWILLTLYAE